MHTIIASSGAVVIPKREKTRPSRRSGEDGQTEAGYSAFFFPKENHFFFSPLLAAGRAVGGSCEVAYSTAKAGVIGFTKALAKEVGPSGIQVNCIAPGVIDTAMNARLSAEDLAALRDETPLGRLGTPEDVAKLALFLAEDTFITGEVLHIGGGYLR